MTSRLENRGAPTIWLKTLPNRTKTALVFCFLGEAPRVLERGVISLAGIVAQTQNYKRTWALLKIPLTGRVLWPSFQTFGVGPAKSWDWGGGLPPQNKTP